MNEPFDVEISRALKKETAESLQGWEFTPAMQAKVMQRIRAEAASDDGTADAPSAPPARRRNLVEWARPLTYVAAAAAAVVLAVNVNWSGLGVSSKENAATTDSAPVAERANPTPAPVAGNVEPVTTTATQSAAPKVQPATVDNAGSGTSGNAGAASPPPPTQRSRDVAFALPMPEPAVGAAVLADGFTALAAPPGPAKMAGAHEAGQPEEPTAPTDPADGGQAQFGIAAIAAVENVSGAVAADGAVFTLTTTGLNYTSADLAVVRDISLEELSGVSTVAVAADGKAAVVGGGNRVYLIDATGKLERTIERTEAVELVRWSDDGRLAVADGKQVVVYAAATGESQFAVTAGPAAEVAFAPDGSLAVYAALPDGTRQVVLVDAKGNEVARQNQPAGAGRGLAVVASGKAVVAGGLAYDPKGASLWALPLATTGVIALGVEGAVGWNDKTILNVNAADGKPVWQANWEGTGRITRVVSSPDGSLMVILAETDEGPVLWVVEAGGAVRLTERLEQMPVEIGLAGDQVVMILPTAVQYRAIPE